MSTYEKKDLTNVHIKMFDYFNGVSRLLIPDNSKVGIISHGKHEYPVINRTYRELADYYNTSLLPTRVCKTKDKSVVEKCSVGQVTTHIVAIIQDRTFFDMATLNQAIPKELDALNKATFQKKGGSRYPMYMEKEMPLMRQLLICSYDIVNERLLQLN